MEKNLQMMKRSFLQFYTISRTKIQIIFFSDTEKLISKKYIEIKGNYIEK